MIDEIVNVMLEISGLLVTFPIFFQCWSNYNKIFKYISQPNPIALDSDHYRFRVQPWLWKLNPQFSEVNSFIILTLSLHQQAYENINFVGANFSKCTLRSTFGIYWTETLANCHIIHLRRSWIAMGQCSNKIAVYNYKGCGQRVRQYTISQSDGTVCDIPRNGIPCRGTTIESLGGWLLDEPIYVFTRG